MRTERPHEETREQRTARRRAEALRDLRDAIGKRMAALGEAVAWVKLDAEQTREEHRQHKLDTREAFQRIEQKLDLLLEGQRQLAQKILDLRGKDA